MITAAQARERGLYFIEKGMNARSTFESDLDRERTMVEAVINDASENGRFKAMIQGKHISDKLTGEITALGYKVTNCVDDYGKLSYIYWA